MQTEIISNHVITLCFVSCIIFVIAIVLFIDAVRECRKSRKKHREVNKLLKRAEQINKRLDEERK